MIKEHSKIKVLYIAYVNYDNIFAGSGVRPHKMYDAFIDEGYDVTALYYEQSLKTYKIRKEKVKNIIKLLRNKHFDLCYIESPGDNIRFHYDRKLIKLLYKHAIPVGYYYRDFHMKFPELFYINKDIISTIRNIAMRVLQFLTDRVLRYCSIIYVASPACKTLIRYDDVRTLPPAGNNLHSLSKPDCFTGIYVGGIEGHYNGSFLLEAFEELYNRNNNYKLILVCRKAEFDRFSSEYKSAKWLSVYHLSMDDLEPLYAKSSFSVAALKKDNIYNKFAISVKTFEYMEHGLPQIVVNNESIKEFIDREKVGIAVNEDVNEFADAVQYLVENSEVYNKYRNNVKESLLKRNLWKHRVDTVVRDLLSIKKDK